MLAGILSLIFVLVVHVFMFALCKAAGDRKDDE